MCARTAANSGSAVYVVDILATSCASSGPSISICANSSRISGCSLAVSAARAEATMTAVAPTLVAMSQVSSSERPVLMPASSAGLHGPHRRRAYSCAFRGHELRECVLVVGHRHAPPPAVQPAHLVVGVLGGGPPAVVVEPVDNDRAIVVVIDQVLDVDGPLNAELIGHPLKPVAHLLPSLVGVVGRGFRRNPAARRAQLSDLGEQPVLSVRGQIHQQ